MGDPIVQFIVLTILCALLMWGLTRIETLDQGFIRFIRIVLMIVLTVLALNVVLNLLFGHTLPYYLSGPR